MRAAVAPATSRLRKDIAIQISRSPHPILAPFVELLWATSPDAQAPRVSRERMLPAVSGHLVIRLGGKPLRLFANNEDEAGCFVSHAVVGGVREAAYVKDSSDPAPAAPRSA